MLPTVYYVRKWARLRNASTGTRQVVDVRPRRADNAIEPWGKLGYDLHDRSRFEESYNPRLRMQVEHVVLTFVKR